MILLGYDLARQVTIAQYQGRTIICDNSDRACEIVNGLCAVAEKIPPNEPVSLGKDENGVEVVIQVQTPWMRMVRYSDQAWNDLLSVEAV